MQRNNAECFSMAKTRKVARSPARGRRGGVPVQLGWPVHCALCVPALGLCALCCGAWRQCVPRLKSGTKSGNLGRPPTGDCTVRARRISGDIASGWITCSTSKSIIQMPRSTGSHSKWTLSEIWWVVQAYRIAAHTHSNGGELTAPYTYLCCRRRRSGRKASAATRWPTWRSFEISQYRSRRNPSLSRESCPSLWTGESTIWSPTWRTRCSLASEIKSISFRPLSRWYVEILCMCVCVYRCTIIY